MVWVHPVVLSMQILGIATFLVAGVGWRYSDSIVHTSHLLMLIPRTSVLSLSGMAYSVRQTFNLYHHKDMHNGKDVYAVIRAPVWMRPQYCCREGECLYSRLAV